MLIQLILLRRAFKLSSFLQVAVGVVFGYFTTFCNWGVSFLPTPENLGIRLAMICASASVLVGFVLGILNRKFGDWRDRLLDVQK